MLNPRHQQALDTALEKIRNSSISSYIDDIILYGSCARHQNRWSSDVDILVVFKPDFVLQDEYRHQFRKMQADILDISITDPEIDMHIVIGDGWQNDRSQYYRNIQKGGVHVWQ